jgi:hypothetical protein
MSPRGDIIITQSAVVEELVGVAGRRGGKTRAVATLAAYLVALVDYGDVELGNVGACGSDRAAKVGSRISLRGPSLPPPGRSGAEDEGSGAEPGRNQYEIRQHVHAKTPMISLAQAYTRVCKNASCFSRTA